MEADVLTEEPGPTATRGGRGYASSQSLDAMARADSEYQKNSHGSETPAARLR